MNVDDGTVPRLLFEARTQVVGPALRSNFPRASRERPSFADGGCPKASGLQETTTGARIPQSADQLVIRSYMWDGIALETTHTESDRGPELKA